MAVPEFQAFMAPTLHVLKDGKARHWRKEVEPLIIAELGLADEDYEDVLPSGVSRIKDRLGWAATYLAQAELLTRPERGYLQITPAGLNILAKHPDRVDRKILSQFTRFDEFSNRKKKRMGVDAAVAEDLHSEAVGLELQEPDSPSFDSTDERTPFEVVEIATQQLQEEFVTEALRRIHGREPEFLEKLSLRLISEMSYGRWSGKIEHAGRPSGDGGIDGVVWTDELGIDRVYIQVKRYATGSNVQRPELQQFVGALHGKHANRGVFITTSKFSSGAVEYANNVPTRIALIDGIKLVELMIKYKVGMQVARTFVVHQVDERFFDPDNLLDLSSR